MNDSEFLRHLQATDKIEYYLFGCSPFWKIKGTGLSLHEEQRLKEIPYGCCSESRWLLGTTRYTIILKSSEFGSHLEEFWNNLDFVKLEEEGKERDEWFIHTPDF